MSTEPATIPNEQNNGPDVIAEISPRIEPRSIEVREADSPTKLNSSSATLNRSPSRFKIHPLQIPNSHILLTPNSDPKRHLEYVNNVNKDAGQIITLETESQSPGIKTNQPQQTNSQNVNMLGMKKINKIIFVL